MPNKLVAYLYGSKRNSKQKNQETKFVYGNMENLEKPQVLTLTAFCLLVVICLRDFNNCSVTLVPTPHCSKQNHLNIQYFE